MRLASLVFKTLILFTLAHLITVPALSQLIPVEHFGRSPLIQRMAVSPDGKTLAIVQSKDGRPILATYEITPEGLKNPNAMPLDPSQRLEERIGVLYWANNDRLLLSIRFAIKFHGVPVTATRLVSISSDLSESKQIPRQSRKAGTLNAQFQDDIIHLLPNDPEHILIAYDKGGFGRELDAYRLNIYTGAMKRLLSGNMDMMGYAADQHGNIRYRLRYSEKKKRGIPEVRLSVDGKWQKLWRDGEDDMYFLGFANQPNEILIDVDGVSGRGELWVFDLNTRQLVEQKFSQLFCPTEAPLRGTHRSLTPGFSSWPIAGMQSCSQISGDPQVMAQFSETLAAKVSGASKCKMT